MFLNRETLFRDFPAEKIFENLLEDKISTEQDFEIKLIWPVKPSMSLNLVSSDGEESNLNLEGRGFESYQKVFGLYRLTS